MYNSLRDHFKNPGLKIGSGHQTVFSNSEEKQIVAALQALEKIGFGLTRDLASVVIHDYLADQPDRVNPFKDCSWQGMVMNRWAKELSVRKPGYLPTQRAVASSSEVLYEWYDKVEKRLEETGLSALTNEEFKKRLWNCDESAFCLSATSKRIFCKRGERDVHETVCGSGREYITILGAACANGTRLPPYIVYKGKHLWSQWTRGGPAGALYSVSTSWWMEGDNFLQWFEKMFVPAVSHMTTGAPVFLFFDGHHSHINNIHLICFPPQATHTPAFRLRSLWPDEICLAYCTEEISDCYMCCKCH